VRRDPEVSSVTVLRFALERVDPASGARAGRLFTAHGEVETPVFMPVGTQAAVRAMTPDQVRATGARILLANTYHLAVQPGERLVRKAGGLHSFMSWDGPILTDSGGFQVFSLPDKEVTAEGVRFRPSRDGTDTMMLTPERAVQIQHDLGSDILMALDECTPYPATHGLAASGVANTLAWLKRCCAAHAGHEQESALFGIVQGSVYEDLRRRCAEAVTQFDLPGYAVGGVSVGEGHEQLVSVMQMTLPFLPHDRPRYVMGIGLPDDLVAGVACGADMFDCVIPTRYARSATLFTRRGQIRITRGTYRSDFFPIDPSCTCYACTGFSRAYIHHLYAVNEILGTTLGAIHNVTFYQSLMRELRAAILAGDFAAVSRRLLEEYRRGDGRSRKRRDA
jgi:queuine tRNA-ribosyltransferase